MKKLMFAVAAVCAAAMVQAASIDWGDGYLVNPGGDDAGAECQLTTFYFGTDSVEDKSASTAYNYIYALGATDGSKFIFDNVDNGILTVKFESEPGVTFSKTFTAVDEAMEFDGAGYAMSSMSGTASGTDYYFATLITATDEEGKITHYIGNVGAVTGNGKVQTLDNMGNTWGGDGRDSGDAVTWAAVPEPTSGLLLLLGVAGLALRRRRA